MSSTHRAFAFATVFSSLIAYSGPAFAHATLEVTDAPANSYYKATVRIGHGCEGEATHTVAVSLPEGFILAKPMPKHGWKIETESGAFKHSYKLHGKTIGDGVKAIRWSGGDLLDAHYDEFILRGRLTGFKAGTTLAFPVVQTCAKGERRWDEIPAEGQDPHSLKSPAPILRISDSGKHVDHGAKQRSAHSVGMASVEHISVKGAWTRQTPPGAKVGGGYMTITNNGTADDVLVGGSVEIAKRLEVHNMSMTDGVMKMEQLANGLVIPTGGSVELKPGGLHMMFMGLTASPQKGDIISATLKFKNAGELSIKLPVEAIGARSPHGMTKHDGHGQKKPDGTTHDQ